MEVVTVQLMFFLESLGFGAVLFFLYDIIRGFRRIFIHKSFFIIIEDLFFWMLVGIISFRFLCWYNQGELRGFFFLGLGIGMILYFKLASKMIINISTVIFDYLKRFCKYIYYLLFRPVLKINTNIRWQLKKEKKKVKMALKNGKIRGDADEDGKKIQEKR